MPRICPVRLSETLGHSRNNVRRTALFLTFCDFELVSGAFEWFGLASLLTRKSRIMRVTPFFDVGKKGVKTDGYATCLSRGTSKNGARVAFTARCASTPSCSKPLWQNGQSSNSPRLACLANHSPQCQHFTTAVTHMPSTSPPSGRVLVRVLFRVGI